VSEANTLLPQALILLLTLMTEFLFQTYQLESSLTNRLREGELAYQRENKTALTVFVSDRERLRYLRKMLGKVIFKLEM